MWQGARHDIVPFVAARVGLTLIWASEGGQKGASERGQCARTDRPRPPHPHPVFAPDPVPFIIETGELSNQFSSWNERTNEKQPINDHEHDSDWVGQCNGDGEGDPLPIPIEN